MDDLLAIKRALASELKSEAHFSFINTRLILRVGVDLSKIEEPVVDAQRARKAIEVLREMGFLNGEVP